MFDLISSFLFYPMSTEYILCIHPILVAFGVIVALNQGLQQMFPPFQHWMARKTNKKFPRLVPDVGQLCQMLFRGDITQQQYVEYANENGYNNEFAYALQHITRNLLDANTYIEAFRRGIIKESHLKEKLTALGYDAFDTAVIKNVTEYFPNPGDLIQFAVREVYSPEIVSKFGQKEDFPEKFAKEAEKLGISREQSLNYWAAHWNLPSAQQGFEMLHRRVIDEGELNILLRALDVMPFWRDALTKISYNPLTRVDVRRMHALGILGANEVYEAYLDFGYSPENAERMKNFTIQYNNSSATSELKALLDETYEKGYLSEDEYIEELESLTQNREAAEYEASIKSFQKILIETDDKIETLRLQFVKGEINIDEARNALNALNLKSTQQESLIAKFESDKKKYHKLPTKADLQSWLKKSVISSVEFETKMTALGYERDDIQYYLEAVGNE